MKYVWWLTIIIMYLITLLIYVVVDSIFFSKEEKLNSIDAVFFGVLSVITMSIIPMLR